MAAFGYEDKLRDASLQDVAYCFVSVDLELLKILRSYSSNEFGLDGPRLVAWRRSQRHYEMTILDRVIEELEHVEDETWWLHKNYLRSTSLITYWIRASFVILQMMDKGLRAEVEQVFDVLEKALHPLPDHVYTAAKQGLLSSEDQDGLRVRMLQLDELFNLYHWRCDTARTLFYW